MGDRSKAEVEVKEYKGISYQLVTVGKDTMYHIFHDNYISGWYVLPRSDCDKFAKDYIDKVILKGKKNGS